MNIIDRIVPVPRKLHSLGADALRLGAYGAVKYTVQADIPEELTLAQNAVKRLDRQLIKLFGTEPCDDADAVRITLSLGSAPADIENPEQGYCLRIEDRQIELTGFGEPGLFYAVTTLLQCLRPENGVFALPAFEVLDYPMLKTRGHFVETRYGSDLMELEDWKQVVDTMVDQKQNQLTVSVYGCWVVQFDGRVSEYVFTPFEGYPDLKTPVFKKYYSAKTGQWVNEEVATPMHEKDFLGQLMVYGKENGVEVVPMINSLGHNTLIPRLYPEVSAKDENGEPSFTGYCTSNPKTYELIFDLYDQLIDRYAAPNGITSFDIGMDEVRDGMAYLAGDVGRLRSPWCKCPACREKSKGDILIGHAVKLMKHLKEKGMKTVYMYNDMIVEHKTVHNGGNPANRAEQFMRAMKENDLLDVACLDWWSYKEQREQFPFKSTQPELGLRATVKPWNGYFHWAFMISAVKNNYHMSNVAREDGVEGVRSYSAWDNSYHRNHQIQADYFWNREGTGEPHEASARYARRHFPTAVEDAVRAFDCMDDFTRRRNQKDPNNTETSRYDMLFENMTSYRYTYFIKGKDYPRNYPGEMVPRLRTEPEYMEDVQKMHALATEAFERFGRIAQTPGCDRTLALRYQYEARNYRNICRDWISIMEMDTLAQQFAESKDAQLLKRIARIAGDQKNSRLEQLEQLEQIKEHYLIPSHARNQCIPMQYFADVERYVTQTPPEQMKLDFADLRHIASEQFTFLR